MSAIQESRDWKDYIEYRYLLRWIQQTSDMPILVRLTIGNVKLVIFYPVFIAILFENIVWLFFFVQQHTNLRGLFNAKTILVEEQ